MTSILHFVSSQVLTSLFSFLFFDKKSVEFFEPLPNLLGVYSFSSHIHRVITWKKFWTQNLIKHSTNHLRFNIWFYCDKHLELFEAEGCSKAIGFLSLSLIPLKIIQITQLTSALINPTKLRQDYGSFSIEVNSWIWIELQTLFFWNELQTCWMNYSNGREWY